MECNKCGGVNNDESLYCIHCGVRLDTKACRQCGDYVPQEAKFCPHCGMRTQGKVCSRCGTLNPDEARFCLSCGNNITKPSAVAANVHTASAVNASVPYPAQNRAPVQNGAVVQKGNSGIASYVFAVVRAFVLPLLLLCIFISSFFGVISFETSVEGIKLKSQITGVDAVRGMFLLIDPPTAAESADDFDRYMDEHGYTAKIKQYIQDKQRSKVEKCMGQALQRYGVLRFVITEDTQSKSTTAQVLLWGLVSLGTMVVSLTFFVISLVHAIKVACKKATGHYKHEVLPLALLAATAFSFVILGGGIGSGMIAIMVLGLIGVGGAIAMRYTVERSGAPFSLVPTLRRAICLVLAVIVASIATTNVLFIHADYDNGHAKTSVSANDLMAGMDITFDDEELEKFSETDTRLKEYIESKSYDSKTKKLMLTVTASPIVACSSYEAVDLFGIPACIVSWILYFVTVLFAASVIMLLMQLLREEATGKTHKGLLWNILVLVSAVVVTAAAVVFTVFGQVVTTELNMHISYSVGTAPIVGLLFAIGMLVVDCVLRGKAQKKAVPPSGERIEQAAQPVEQTAQPEQSATQPAQTLADEQAQTAEA